MLKKLSVSKSQIAVLVLLLAAVIGRAMAVMFRKGKPSVEAMAFGVLLCLLYALLLIWKFPTQKEEFFTVLTAGVVFIGALSIFYVNAAFNFVVSMIAVTVFCSSNIKLVPISVVTALLVLVRYEPFAFTVIPAAVITMIILVAPKLKDSKAWEKIVFSGALISLIACFVYVVYQMRFIFSFSTFFATPKKTIPLIMMAAVFVVCAVISLKTVKAPKSKKNSK